MRLLAIESDVYSTAVEEEVEWPQLVNEANEQIQIALSWDRTGGAPRRAAVARTVNGGGVGSVPIFRSPLELDLSDQGDKGSYMLRRIVIRSRCIMLSNDV